jgi:hypothetical protein
MTNNKDKAILKEKEKLRIEVMEALNNYGDTRNRRGVVTGILTNSEDWNRLQVEINRIFKRK